MRKIELMTVLSKGIEVIGVDMHPECIVLRYANKGVKDRVIMERNKDLYKVLIEFNKINTYEGDTLFLFTYQATRNANGSYGMTMNRVVVDFTSITFNEDEAKELCTRHEYREALQQAGIVARVEAKVISMFTPNQKKTA